MCLRRKIINYISQKEQSHTPMYNDIDMKIYDIEVKNYSFEWPVAKEESQKKEIKVDLEEPLIVNEEERSKKAFCVSNIDLKVSKGQLIAVIGKSGSGKTSIPGARR